MVRKAIAVWRGTGRAGNGNLSTDSGVLANTPYSFKTRFENEKGTKNMSIGMRRREAAAKFNGRLGKYPGRPNRQFLQLWKMPGGFEAVSRANPWLFAGPGIGIKYLSIGRRCVDRVSHGAGQFREYIIFRLRLKIVS